TFGVRLGNIRSPFQEVAKTNNSISTDVDARQGAIGMMLPAQVRFVLSCAAVIGDQGQLQLSCCSDKDFQQEVFVPAATAAFHRDAVSGGMLLQQGKSETI